MSVTLSVIIPVFSRQKKAEAAINSVLDQNHDSFELIIVDDASPVPFVLPEVLKLDPRIRVIVHSENRGAGGARNTGILNSTGDCIAFLDSDDVWEAEKINLQLSLARTIKTMGHEGLFAVVTGFDLTSSVTSIREMRVPIGSNDLADFVSGCWFCPGSTLLVERRAFEIVGYYDETLSRLEDYDWFIRFAQAHGQLIVLNGNYVKIEAGSKPPPSLVKEARAKLLQKFETGSKSVVVLSKEHLKLMKSYLALEVAAAQYADKNKLFSFASLVKSFLLKPRTGLHLKNWWQPGD